MPDENVVVVGAGLGGLSAAAYLARNGLEVDVFERNPHPGGYACSFRRGRFEFEASLHELSGIGPEGNRGSCYRILEGCDVAGRVEFLPIEDFYTSRFPDFEVTVPVGWEEAEDAFSSGFPAEREGVRRLLAFMRSAFREMAILSEEPGALDLLAFPVTGSHLLRSFGLTVSQAMDREISDPRLKALFCDIWGYYGLPPSRLSFLLFAVGNASYIEHGPYHIKGTSQALSNAFVEVIEENGGRVHLRNGVSRIRVSDGRVTGVVTEQGDEVATRYVMCNANPVHVCYDLIGADNIPRKYLKAMAACHTAVGTLNIYAGLDCPASELGMSRHELFINDSYDQDEHYRAMFTLERPRYWALTNYNAADPDFSPPGTCVMVITCPMDHGAWVRVPPDRYLETKNRLAARIIDEADRVLPGFKDHLEVVEVSTPVTNMRFSGNPGGSYLGFDYDVSGSPMMRLPNRGPIEGLYFGNAWVRIGGGFEPAMTSGFFAFGEIMKDVKGVRGLKKYLPGFA